MLSGKGSSTKKTLKFATPNGKNENSFSPVGKLIPKKLDNVKG